MKISDTLAPGKYRYCSKHIVVMTWFDQDVKKNIEEPWRYFAISGFVMSFEDRWYLATAGHVVKAIENNRTNGLTRSRSFGIIDHGGVEAVHRESYPFDYESAEKYWVEDEDGLDFGFIEIKPFYRKLMEANSVTAIDESHWDRDESEYEEYFVMGLPSDQQIRLGGIERDEVTLEGWARIIVMPILKVSDDDAPPQKSTQVIFARVRDERVTNVKDVDGFSGSPVFGMGPKDEQGRLPYRVVAMQYAWDQKKRVVILSPVRTFARLFQQHLAEHKK